MEKKERFEKLLRETGGLASKRFLRGLAELGFFKAPASTRFHGSEPGGLLACDTFYGLPSRAIGNTVIAAYAGEADAMNNLAVLRYCEIANPMEYDEKSVIDLLRRAERLGCKVADANLGVLHENRGEKGKRL